MEVDSLIIYKTCECGGWTPPQISSLFCVGIRWGTAAELAYHKSVFAAPSSGVSGALFLSFTVDVGLVSVSRSDAAF